ncbi:bZIP transcription factor [Cicer arietinum]|uniref:BZIP transcription factor n=1 Tax=Cicer arietinum TaxID=3827 RepID=A0A3Q7K7C8_CICAR|nr:bZIP transcription factor [Cicer arietinum]
MASIQRPVSSGSSDGGDLLIDERKRKRMLSNRESARRSRMRKQKQIEDLTEESGRLRSDNDRLSRSIKATEEAYVEMEAANSVIRAQTMELTERLRFLNSVIEFAEDVGGSIPVIPDPLLNPWHIYHPIHPLMASPDMFLH